MSASMSCTPSGSIPTVGSSRIRIDAPRGLVGRNSVQGCCKREVLTCGQARVETNVVGQISDTPFDLDGLADRVQSRNPGLALKRFGEPEKHEDGCRLSGTVRAEEAKDFTHLNLQIEMVDGGKVAVLLGEILSDYRGSHAAR
jgi:hypothetical protein